MEHLPSNGVNEVCLVFFLSSFKIQFNNDHGLLKHLFTHLDFATCFINEFCVLSVLCYVGYVSGCFSAICSAVLNKEMSLTSTHLSAE